MMQFQPEREQTSSAVATVDDVISAGAGDDQVFGGAQADVIYGDAGADRLFGEAGNDLITAGAGNDTVFGGTDDDLIVAEIGDGNDVYFGDDSDGGAGSDTLDISAATAEVTVNLGAGALAHGSATSAQYRKRYPLGNRERQHRFRQRYHHREQCCERDEWWRGDRYVQVPDGDRRRWGYHPGI